jgi:hypothetical protein
MYSAVTDGCESWHTFYTSSNRCSAAKETCDRQYINPLSSSSRGSVDQSKISTTIADLNVSSRSLLP